jgi:hypothetical protein
MFMLRRAFAIAVVVVFPMVASAQSSGSIIPRLSGTWKEDVSKRQIGSLRHLVFRRSAGGNLEELRGADLRPLVQPVNFTGKPYTFDGSKNTIAWTQHDPRTFERAIYNQGKLLNTRRIKLSADGKTLTEQTEIVRPSGGKILSTITYRRISGDKGLAGRWKPESSKTDTPPQVKYEAVGTNGLKVSTAEDTTSFTVMLDSKPAPLIGPAVIPGTMVAAKQVNPSTIEMTNSREGVDTRKSTRTLSSDGKTLTVTDIAFGPTASKEPSVSVYLKQ